MVNPIGLELPPFQRVLLDSRKWMASVQPASARSVGTWTASITTGFLRNLGMTSVKKLLTFDNFGQPFGSGRDSEQFQGIVNGQQIVCEFGAPLVEPVSEGDLAGSLRTHIAASLIQSIVFRLFFHSFLRDHRPFPAEDVLLPKDAHSQRPYPPLRFRSRCRR